MLCFDEYVRLFFIASHIAQTNTAPARPIKYWFPLWEWRQSPWRGPFLLPDGTTFAILLV